MLETTCLGIDSTKSSILLKETNDTRMKRRLGMDKYVSIISIVHIAVLMASLSAFADRSCSRLKGPFCVTKLVLKRPPTKLRNQSVSIKVAGIDRVRSAVWLCENFDVPHQCSCLGRVEKTAKKSKNPRCPFGVLSLHASVMLLYKIGTHL